MSRRSRRSKTLSESSTPGGLAQSDNRPKKVTSISRRSKDNNAEDLQSKDLRHDGVFHDEADDGPEEKDEEQEDSYGEEQENGNGGELEESNVEEMEDSDVEETEDSDVEETEDSDEEETGDSDEETRESDSSVISTGDEEEENVDNPKRVIPQVKRLPLEESNARSNGFPRDVNHSSTHHGNHSRVDVSRDSNNQPDTNENAPPSLEEVKNRIRPYISQGTTLAEACKALEGLGVQTVSDILELDKDDVKSVIKPVQFRKLQKALKEKQENKKKRDLNTKLYKTVPLSLRKKIEMNVKLLYPEEMTRFIDYVSDALYDIHPSGLKQNLLQEIACKFVAKYQHSFGGGIGDDSHMKQAAKRMQERIKDRYYYYKSFIRKRQRGAPQKRQVGAKSKACGLPQERDNPPNLPEGETNETQNDKRKAMVAMKKSNAAVPANVLKYMKDTYVTQRRDIFKELTMDRLLERWPYFGDKNVLENHFCYLMKDLNMNEVRARAQDILPLWIKYFQHCSVTGRKKRDVDGNFMPHPLREVLERHADMDSSDDSNIITVILCLLMKLKIPKELIFVSFREDASYHDVQAYKFALPTPIIAVLGTDLQCNPKVFIVVENTVLRETTVRLADALLELVMVYFVLRMRWKPEISPVLEFLQWKIFEIETWENSRTERKRYESGTYAHAQTGMCRALTTLTSEFKNYLTHKHYN